MLRNFFGSIFKVTVVILIRIYRVLLSPFLGGQCRFYPSCSQYGLDAYEAHSFLKATSLILCRLLKCHPLGPKGFDPIPSKENS